MGEKSVKGKIEQMTQRTWNVPIFDTFNLTTKFKDPPLQGFDYRMDAYLTLKYNFDGVYDVFNNIANITNNFVSKNIEAPIQETMKNATDTFNNNVVTDTGFDLIQQFDQNINLNRNDVEGDTGMIDYRTAKNELKQGLLKFEASTLTDKTMNDRVKTIIATVDNVSTIKPATKQIEEVRSAAQGIIDEKRKENLKIEQQIQDYDTFIKKLKNDEVVLVDEK